MAFDPYYQWLGIPPDEQPPHFYKLLGLRLYESNAEAIGNAADRQMIHLRNFQTGKHSAESQKLMNEVSAARVCLLNTDRKATYDLQLKEFIANQVAFASPSDLPPASAPAPSYGQPPGPVPGYGIPTYPVDPYQAAPYPVDPYQGAPYQGAPYQGAPYQPAPYPNEYVPAGPPPAAEPPAAYAAQYAYPVEPPSAPAPVPAFSTPLPSETISQPIPVVATRANMPIAVEPRSQSGETQPTLKTENSSFEYSRKRSQSMPLETVKVIVGGIVGCIAALFILWYGFKKDPLHIVPPGKTVASKEGTKASRHGHSPSVTETHRHVQETSVTPTESHPKADNTETSSKTTPVVPANEAPKPEPPKSEVKTPETKTPEAKPMEAPAVPIPVPVIPPMRPPMAITPSGQKMSPPADGEVATATLRINDVYQVANAMSRDEKKALIKTLTTAAQDSDDKPVDRYALFRKGLEIAESIGDTGEALKAIYWIEAYFEIDSLAEKEKALTAALTNIQDQKGIENYLRRAKSLIWEAMAATRYDIAKRTTEVSYQACTTKPFVAKKDRDLVVEGRPILLKLCEKWDEYQKAVKALETNPEDRKAHRTAGLWLCLNREEWSEGLIHLAKSGDKNLSKMATDDLANPVEANSQIRLAEGWNDLSRTAGGEYEKVKLRAYFWYLQALPKLSRLERAKHEARLTSLAELKLTFAERVVLWNSPLSITDDRATAACHVSLYRGDVVVWQKRDLRVNYQRSAEASTVVELPAIPFDMLRIDVTEWHKNGAGLAEIQVFHNNKNIAITRKPKVSGNFVPSSLPIGISGNMKPESLTNSDIPKTQLDDGYWFLSDKTPGSVEISFKDSPK